MRDLNLKSEYSSSHALIVGIDDYKHAAPLRNAVEDAKAVAEVVQTAFLFPKDQVILILNKEATKEKILSTYLAYEKTADPDSRLLVFFAGHGFTKSGRNGEIGFLIPYDGNMDDTSTLIRWEELTRNADLIPAKHIFYVMDACHGGLIFNRAVSAGSVRFLKDLIIRPARQALAAGKDDQLVSDGGGPRPKHSIFTGHFLDALEGAARAKEGHLTANAVMSYVYKQVGNDIHSEQTPQYGFLSGDGDFIFDAPQLKTIGTSETSETDTYINFYSQNLMTIYF